MNQVMCAFYAHRDANELRQIILLSRSFFLDNCLDQAKKVDFVLRINFPSDPPSQPEKRFDVILNSADQPKNYKKSFNKNSENELGDSFSIRFKPF